MKKILSFIVVILLVVTTGYSQSPAPGIFNYQGVARNSVGNVLQNQSISLRLTIHDGAPAGPVVYQETRAVVTNPFGLFNAQVGSPGATLVTGTIAGVNWGVGNKYIQVEINYGVGLINIGTAQIASVPYSLYSSLSNDLVLPFLKTQADAGTLFRINNSGTGISGAIMGTTLSPASNAWGVHGQVNNPAAGGFSAGVLGTNLSTTLNGIGVFGSQNGSGWGVYGVTPSGIGVNGLSTSGSGVFGSTTSGTGVNAFASTGDGLRATTNGAFGKFGVFGIATADATGVAGNSGSGIAVLGVSNTGPSGVFQNFTAASTATTLTAFNQGGSGDAFSSITTGTGRAGFFQVNNAASGADALFTSTNGGAASWALRATSTGLQGAGIFTYNNAAGAANAIRVTNNGSGAGISATASGTGSAGLFSNTNAANNASPVVITTNSTNAPGLSISGPNIWGSAMGITNTTSGMEWRTSVNGTTYTVTKIPGSTFSPFLLFSDGQVEFPNTAGTNRLRILDNGNVGIGNAAPTQRLHVTGTVRIQDGTEANNFILRSNAVGDANWVDPAVIIPGAFLWTRVGTNLWNTNLGDAVGVGTVAPTHRFTVSHGGSTGISVSSTAGFSVVDINAASGDAALRFGNAGVNQWNIRNRPADNYLEIFELGGGGSRVVIQDGTGNVGIGQTVAPAYKLDVLHSGATGIRSQSSASFSVVDIDANSGDAALRFQKAGVGMWNTRNRPADDYYEIFELGGGGSRVVIQDGTGNVGIGATVAPAYKLDVEHGGATGLRVLSTASFSVVDIDAQSGDAALRFVKAGVNQWNTRNRPADDYYEIFELGGGGSRFVIQDATGNVGIGATVAPAYKLDVEHGGATGIRSKSTATFSVVDIDAQSGDAALRFQKAGVNQWNVRNRPADDYFEIFELGGGGSRVVIQDATGNVGIGATVAPAYKLDVEHGGATGIRSKSTATFSVVDIDAQSGDAALRFQKAGVNQWNTRNNPATDDYQIFELGGGGERFRIDNTTGNINIAQSLNIVGTLTKGAGAFKIDHPLDPANKYLVHSFVESPDMMNIYNGNIITDASGKATVQLPDYFEALNMEFRYQLTVIGAFAQAIINKEVSNNKFEIATNQPNVKVSWQVTGVRHDAYAQQNRIPNAVEKETKNKGKYMHPQAFNQPASKGIGYTDPNENNGVSSLKDVQLTPAKVANPLNTTGGSLGQMPVQKITAKPVDNSGSVANMEPTKTVVKPVDNSGSVAPQAEVKKAEVKPVEEKGTSIEALPKKAVEEKKKTVDPGSTKTD